MQNTKTEYGSYQRMPVVLPEMEELLPPLSAEQFSALESDILENGCYAPVIVNEDMVIIDGHNRFCICEKHGLPFRMLVFSFADLLEAKQWALDTQKGRRNLEKWELGKIALKLKPEIEARAKANMSAGGGNQKSEGAKSGLATLPNPISAVDTRKELADAVGLGERTMGKVMQIDAEADRRGRISGLFCKAFERAVALTPTAENVHIWVECTRMRPDEIEYSVQESYELAQVFQKIGDLLKEEITPREPQADEL